MAQGKAATKTAEQRRRSKLRFHALGRPRRVNIWANEADWRVVKLALRGKSVNLIRRVTKYSIGAIYYRCRVAGVKIKDARDQMNEYDSFLDTEHGHNPRVKMFEQGKRAEIARKRKEIK